jgi:hypothetical protein
LLQRIDSLWAQSTSAKDDTLIAGFALYGISAVHPFDNGNGRAAVDFAQLLLMHRWASARPPLTLAHDTHRLLGGVLAPLDEPCSGKSAQEFMDLQRGIARRFAAADITWLARQPAFAAIGTWLFHQR